MANQICNPETTTHNPTNDANTVNTGSYKARLTASIYPSDKSAYVSKLSQVKHLIVSLSLTVASRWLLICLFLFFPIQSFASSDYRNRFFDKDYANSVWENYPTVKSIDEYTLKYGTPKIKEAYNKWGEKFRSMSFKKSQKSLDYLAQQPLGKEIKELKDIRYAYKTWENQFITYARCVEVQYLSKQPFLIFEDFQKAKAIYVDVDCNGVGIKCSEYSSEGYYEEVGQCKFFPDWREEKATPWVGRYPTYEKNGIHAVLPD